MNPYFDEKLITIISKGCRDYIAENLHVSAEREAYGPSKNEGLCYESCQSIESVGEIPSMLYFGMDGYTRMKLLPRMAELIEVSNDMKGMVDSILMEYANQMGARIVNDLIESNFEVDIGAPANLNHKLVPIDRKTNRQYIIIFFLRDRRMHEYLGRIYIVYTIKKF